MYVFGDCMLSRVLDFQNFKFLCATVVIFGRLFVKQFALCCQTIVCLSVCLSVCRLPCPAVFCLSCPVCSVTLVYCGQKCWTGQDETWRADRPRPWPHCVRWGPSSPSSKGAQPPNFRPISVVDGQDATW